MLQLDLEFGVSWRVVKLISQTGRPDDSFITGTIMQGVHPLREPLGNL